MNAIVTIGTDPEVLLLDGHGKPTASCGLFGGDKGRPIPLMSLGNGYSLQEDNVSLEWGVPPSTNVGDFVASIELSLAAIKQVAARKGLFVANAAGLVYTSEALSHPKAHQFGCSPDYDAYSHGSMLPRIDPMDLYVQGGRWGFAGGHIHIGYNRQAPAFVAAGLCDAFIGLPSVRWDKQGVRRQYYGSAGRFRPTAYGVEYRTLSNAWVFSGEITTYIGQTVFELGALLNESDQTRLRSLYSAIPWTDVRRAINTEDVAMADALMAHIRGLHHV
jgi:hypothetical protein